MLRYMPGKWYLFVDGGRKWRRVKIFGWPTPFVRRVKKKP